MFVCKGNKRRYIGSSVDVRERAKEHLRALKKQTHHCRRFQASYNKFGVESFEWRLLEKTERDKLVIREQYWIIRIKEQFSLLNTVFYPGKTTLGFRLTEKQRNKLKGKNAGKNNGMYGKRHTEQSKKRMVESKKSKGYASYKTKQFREKISKIVKGKGNPNYGNFWSEEQKEKMRKNLKRRGGYLGDKNPNYGNSWSDEQKKEASERIKSAGGHKGQRNGNYGKYKIDRKLWPEIYLQIKNKTETFSTIAKKFNIHPTSVRNYMGLYEKELFL